MEKFVVTNFYFNLILVSRSLPRFVIKRVHTIFHGNDACFFIDFEQILCRTIYNGEQDIIIVIIFSKNPASFNLFPIFIFRIFRNDKRTRLCTCEVRSFVIIHKPDHKTTIEHTTRNRSAIQIHNPENHVLAAFLLRIFNNLDIERFRRFTCVLLDYNMLFLSILAERHKMRIIFVGRIFSQILTFCKLFRTVTSIWSFIISILSIRICNFIKERKAVIEGHFCMNRIRQIKIHVIPNVITFFKLIIRKNVCLDFGRVERNVMEFTIEFRFEPERFTCNQLSCNTKMIINRKVSGSHKCTLETGSSTIVTICSLKCRPINISCCIEQDVACVIGISNNLYFRQINIIPGFSIIIPSSFVINISYLNFSIISSTFEIKAIS